MKTYLRVFKSIIAIAGIMIALGAGAQADSSEVVAAGATVQLVSDQFKFTEGPAPDRRGNVYFTDQPNDQIWRYDINGKLSLFMDHSGRSNGLYINRKGDIIACADAENKIWSINVLNKKVKVLLSKVAGKKLNGPNDLWIDGNGGMYFTDPYYQRPYWTRKEPEIRGEKVYYLAAGESEAMVADSALVKPNGIVGTPDGKYLYVADIAAKKTYRYQIGEQGTLSNRMLFAEAGSDGMTLDAAGNLYLTGNGIDVYNAAGKHLEHIAIPGKWTANLCFAGKDRKTLFITASSSVYTLRMKMNGVE